MIRSANLAIAACAAALLAACGGRDPGQDDERPQTTAPADVSALASGSPTMDATGAPAAEAPPAAETQPTAQATPKVAADDESAILDDPRGQWATSAQASSTYRGPGLAESYSAWQATGAPNVPRYSDHALAWASKNSDGGVEWLEVAFAEPVHADAVRVRQNHAPGAIVKLELIDIAGGRHTMWEGVDEGRGQRDRIVWFEREFERTPYRVRGVKVTLASDEVWGWNEIDAVQLLDADAKTTAAAHTLADGAAVRVESGYLESGWLEGTVGPSPSGCRMVFLSKPASGGYTSIALMTLKRIERRDGTSWQDVPVQGLLDKEPSHCLEAAAD